MLERKKSTMFLEKLTKYIYHQFKRKKSWPVWNTFVRNIWAYIASNIYDVKSTGDIWCFLFFSQEKEDKANLQAEVQHLREDNLRLQEESHNASEKLKKFTEWVFNTIDMS